MRGQPKRHVPPVRRFQIDRDRLLVAGLQVPPERGALMQLTPSAQRIPAARLFDLDDFGAELGKEPRGKWCRDQSSELDDSYSG
ncbi:hypothetical protein ACVWZ3_004078 [Bradyrhizobium sp. i1.3.6]